MRVLLYNNNVWIKFEAVILPENRVYKKTCIPEVWEHTEEGNLFNCVDNTNLEKIFRVIKVIGYKVYFYPI